MMPKNKVMLGSEHPLCDKVQSTMLILFFAVWGIDALSYFLFRISTIVAEFASFPLLLFSAILSLGLGIYLALKSHEAILGERTDHLRLIDSGVYSWVRHPMYLGTLMVCLGFVFAMFSLLSFGVWAIFFILYDRMAAYEEKDLIRRIGQEYTFYQKRVPKWVPRLRRRELHYPNKTRARASLVRIAPDTY
jgi:protein-S-isoprenylcysteine O-methyltransferase Ste14